VQAEIDRLTFLEDRDGYEEALDFAKRTYKSYRKALMCSRKRGVKKVHHASIPEFRPFFIGSCVVFRRFIYTGSYK